MKNFQSDTHLESYDAWTKCRYRAQSSWFESTSTVLTRFGVRWCRFLPLRNHKVVFLTRTVCLQSLRSWQNFVSGSRSRTARPSGTSVCAWTISCWPEVELTPAWLEYQRNLFLLAMWKSTSTMNSVSVRLRSVSTWTFSTFRLMPSDDPPRPQVSKK